MRKKTIFRRLAACGIIAVMILTGTATAKHDHDVTWKTKKSGKSYVTIFRSHGKIVCKMKTKKRLPVKIMTADKVTYKTLSHRKNKYILIEKYKGVCTNDYGDGETIVNGKAYYISYHNTRGHKYGQKYITYNIHGNDNYDDNVIARFDLTAQ